MSGTCSNMIKSSNEADKAKICLNKESLKVSPIFLSMRGILMKNDPAFASKPIGL